MSGQKIKVTKRPPAPSSNITGTGGMSQAQALGSLQNSKGQILKDVLKESFTDKQMTDILTDPKQMEKIIPAFFAGIMSLEKMFVKQDELNLGSRNSLIGLGKGKSGGYGGHPIEGYLQFNPERSQPTEPAMDPTKDPHNPTKNKPGRIDISSNKKFIKVSQQAEANEYEFLKAFENAPAIAQKFVDELKNQNKINPNDQAAFKKIVDSYQKVYTNKLKEFFSDSDEGQKILGKITPRK
jgi:hypothetical protein